MIGIYKITNKVNGKFYIGSNSVYKNNISNHIIINDDIYSLSILLRWILNVSDITKTINIFVPSSRMRNLLEKWLDNEI